MLTGKECTIPNLLSLLRLVLTPLFLLAAYIGQHNLFWLLFLIALLSDAADGYLARRLGQTSELGARLDSWGDCAVYCATPLAVWWLWPEIIRAQALFVSLAVAAFLLPISIGLLKFGRLTSYHTVGAKIAAVLLAVTTPLLLLDWAVWPFQLAVLVLLLAETEEIAITLILPEWRSDVPSFRHARQQRHTTQPSEEKERDHEPKQ